MGTNRLEAFSDGVLAIIITIMVLELKVPHGTDWKDLAPLAPVFLSYILSFIYVGIYWNNHHHFMHVVDRVDGRILWANLHLLFWLSLIPFTTAWMGENHVGALPTAAYGFVLFMAAMAYLVLSLSVIRIQGKDSAIAKAVGKDVKGKISALMYVAAIILAFWVPALSWVLYALVALMWVIPDRRYERAFTEGH
ncbi:MAG: DUF1211 domain-containing protein [Flavobacteriales bacterium]|nr:DUF1211 domain-containing protein [Flavobacteriales bacterium]